MVVFVINRVPSKMFSSLTVFIVLIGLTFADRAKLPEQILQCGRSDPNLNSCMVKAVQSAIPVFTAGIPKLGVLPLDPMSISQIIIDQDKGPIPIKIDFRNIIIKGLGSAIVTDVKSDLDNYKIVINARIDKPILVESDYDLKGNVLILQLEGHGKNQLKLDDIKAQITLTGKGVDKGGKNYYDLTDLDVQLTTSQLHMNFENLISQNKALGDNVNAFLNENWREILTEIYPAIKEALEATFKEIGRRVFSKFPMDELFLP